MRPTISYEFCDHFQRSTRSHRAAEQFDDGLPEFDIEDVVPNLNYRSEASFISNFLGSCRLTILGKTDQDLCSRFCNVGVRIVEHINPFVRCVRRDHDVSEINVSSEMLLF